MDDPTFKSETVNKLLQQFFRDKQKTKCTGDALKLMAELLRIFIAEGAARAAQQAKVVLVYVSCRGYKILFTYLFPVPIYRPSSDF
ncbi:centromere protein X-like isoform X1 [Orbicella faveolata]|uniref:centromere protein X-like isoform X1 n=1 Tax=Orbicella faveolata TaxID=48498 RepID=UPI0009E53528|nr:centromere protein X-like isoform X1 [Orbicella faveolata]